MAMIKVIVPVYGVERYLKRCIDSILQQTYDDFECILVDDGSPDYCGMICDKYADKDKRITVIHKKNGGVSSARNSALDICGSEGYIAFVDGDDWLDPECFRIVMDKVNKTDCDIVYFNYYAAYSGNNIVFMNSTKKCNYSIDEIRKKFLMDYWLNSVWDKFYKASLFADIRFPKQKSYEDAYVIPQIIMKANRIECIPNALYFYNRCNLESITNNLNSKSAYDIFGSWQMRLNLINEKDEKIRMYCLQRAIKFAVEAFCLQKVDKRMDTVQISEIRQFLDTCRINSGMSNVIWENNVLSTFVGFIVQIKYYIKTVLRRNKIVFTIWMKHKTDQTA